MTVAHVLQSLVILAALAPLGCSESPVDKVQSDDPAKRLAGLEELSRQDTEQALNTATRMITHTDTETAEAAVRAIGRMPRRRAVTVLAKTAAEDPRPTVRQQAALALSYGTEPSSVEVLKQVAKTDAAPQVRAAAATSLGRLGSLADVEFLLAQAESETDPIVQSRAIGALERILGIGFTFDPAAPANLRRVTMERIREAAQIRATVLRKKEQEQPRKAGAA